MLKNPILFLLLMAFIVSSNVAGANPFLDPDSATTEDNPTANEKEDIAIPPPQELGGAPDASKQNYDYRIGHRDLVGVEVFQTEELNHQSRVDSDGDISLPLLGKVNIYKQTVEEAEKTIQDRLREKYLQDPHVTVVILEYKSQVVTLEGWVKTPGVYPLTGRTTFLQAIATARGMDKLADFEEVAIFRKLEGKGVVGYVVSYEKIRSGLSVDPILVSGDVIVVNQSGSKAAWQSTKEIMGAFVGWVPYL